LLLSIVPPFSFSAAKAAIEIPPYILQVITGMLLGDCCLRAHGKDALMLVEQKDFAFVQLLWDLFVSISIVGAAPKTRSRTDNRTANPSTTNFFATFTLPFFTVLFYQWYRIVDGKSIKVLPSIIGDLLTPVAIAFWCDATSISKRCRNTLYRFIHSC
jgi:hypothetical protein